MAAKYLGKAIKRLAVKKTEKTLLNPIGRKLTPFAKTAVVGGVAAWGVLAGGANYDRDTMKRNAEYVGNVGAMDYDATPNVNRTTGKRDFGATGNIVFGLHNSR